MNRRAVLALIATSLAGALAGGPSSAVAGASDASATKQYIAANYALVRTARSFLARAEAAPLVVLPGPVGAVVALELWPDELPHAAATTAITINPVMPNLTVL